MINGVDAREETWDKYMGNGTTIHNSGWDIIKDGKMESMCEHGRVTAERIQSLDTPRFLMSVLYYIAACTIS